MGKGKWGVGLKYPKTRTCKICKNKYGTEYREDNRKCIKCINRFRINHWKEKKMDILKNRKRRESLEEFAKRLLSYK